jgi:glycosyltransferase involved in cell wall biosynthesis
MKILMLAPQPFLEPRGTPISVFQRLQMLSRLGHEVHLVTYHLGADASIPGVEIYRIPKVPFVNGVKSGPSWSKLALDVVLFWKALTMLARRRYDAIHSHEEAAFFAVFLSFLFSTPHIYDMHSSLPQQLRNYNVGNWWAPIRLFEFLERLVLKTSDVVITIGTDLQEHASAINPDARLFKIENLPTSNLSATNSGPTADELKEYLQIHDKLPIVYTGSFERYQGLGLLLDAAKIICGRNPDALFVLVGGKPEQISYWQDEVRAGHLDDRVLFVGTVPVMDSFAYMELAEVLVSPRESGTSVPLKVYSYLFSGKPTVATNLGAHTQVLTEETAVLVEPHAEAFAEGILKLLESPNLRRKLGARAKHLAIENYNPAVQTAKLKSAYESLGSMVQMASRP